MRLFPASLICVLSLTSIAKAQTDQKTITLFSETPMSTGQSAYVRVLSEQLITAGFDVKGEDALVQVERGQIRAALLETGSALGLAYLQTQLSEGDAAAALLLTPGAFTDLNVQRAASQGIIGDAARDEINDEGIFALRLWPHSTDTLVSRTQIASTDDFKGLKAVTGDPYSVAFIADLGATSIQMAFAEVLTGLQAGIADSAVLPQDIFRGDVLDQFTEGTVVPEYRTRTGVTLASSDWWLSLTAGEQRRLLGALEAAEAAAAAAVQEATSQAIAQSLERGIQTVSWQTFDATDLRSAISFSILENSRVDGEAILRLRDDIEALQQRLPEDIDSIEEEQKGSLDVPARVFFATNRRFDPNEPLLSDRFANTDDPTSALRCGELTPAESGRVGSVSGDITLLPGSRVVEADACLAQISSAVRQANGKALVYIHGYRNTFDQAARTGLAFSRDAEIEGVVVVWSWPSAGEFKSYLLDEESVVISEPVFITFSRDLSDAEGVSEVNFLAHSMGSRLLVELMRDDWVGQPSAVVLAAADVSRPFLGQAVKSATSASITLLATEGDLALLASQKIHERTRAGQARPLLLLPGMDTIDLTAFDHWWSKNHGHALSEREVIADLAGLFGGMWTAASRGLQPYRSPGSDIDHYRIAPDGS